MEEQKYNSLIPIESNALSRVSNSITITDKILEELSSFNNLDQLKFWNSLDEFWKFILYDNYVNKDLYDTKKLDDFFGNNGTKKNFYEYLISGVRVFNENEIEAIIEIKSFRYKDSWYYELLDVWEDWIFLDNKNKNEHLLPDRMKIEEYEGRRITDEEFHSYSYSYSCFMRHKIIDFSPLLYCNKLTKVEIYTSGLQSVDFLRKLTSIEKLNIKSDTLIDLEPIKSLNTLIELRLDGWKLKECTFLVNLKNLRVLSMKENQLSELSSFRLLYNIEEVDLSFNKISNIETLSKLPNLTVLNISNNPVSDISQLVNCKKLRSLSISSTQAQMLDSLFDMQALNYLHINIYQDFDFEVLYKMVNLKELSLILRGLAWNHIDKYDVLKQELEEKLQNCKVNLYDGVSA